MIKKISKLLSQSRVQYSIYNQNTYSNSTNNHLEAQLLNLKEKSSVGHVLDVKNDLVYFTNIDNPKVSLFKSLKSDDGRECILIGLREQISTALTLKKPKQSSVSANNGDTATFSVRKIEYSEVQYDRFQLDSQQNFGSIVDFRGEVLSASSTEQQAQISTQINQQFQIFSASEKIKAKRLKTDEQVFSGNMAVDLSNPIAKGNYVVLKGERGTGKSHFLANLLSQFNTPDSNLLYPSLPPPETKRRISIYVASSIQDAENVRKLHRAATHYDPSNYIYLAPNLDSLNGEQFLLPFTALKLARTLIDNHNYDVMIGFDNFYDHFTKEMSIFQPVDQAFSPISIVKELFTNSGVFQYYGGSLTVAIGLDDNKREEIFKEYKIKIAEETESYADVVVDFELQDKIHQNVKPKIDFQSRVEIMRHGWQNKFWVDATENVNSLLYRVHKERQTVLLQQQLKVHTDPWDNYLYLDSRFFMRLFIVPQYFNPITQLIYSKFLLQAIGDETIALVSCDPNTLKSDFFAFSHECQEFDGQNIYESVVELIQQYNNKPEDYSLILDKIQFNIQRLHDLFLMVLQIQNQLLPYQKDYFT